jgi:aryl-alcohol dehydrogenase-like predicted oxidoreductase
MKRRVLGGTGMSVSEFALGAMMFGAGGNPDHDESVRIIHTALDAGINFVDTADIYSRGESEEIVGRALKGRRDDVVLATKFALPMGPDANQAGGSPRWIKRAVEDSLRRLDTDYIDLYQMHRPDHHTDIDETLSALTDLVRSGKVRAIGSSTFPVELIVEAQWNADRHGHRRFLTEQPKYSIRVFDLTVPGNQAKGEAVGRLTQLAAEAGMPLTHLATAFVRSHPAVTSVLIGPRKPEHLDDLLAGSDVVLSEDVLDRIDDIVPPGTELNPADNFFAEPPAIADKRLRRR